MSKLPPSSSARSRMLASPRWPGWLGASGSTSMEAAAVVGDAQLDLVVDRRAARSTPPRPRAWRPALTTASWAMRNSSPATSDGSSTRLDRRPAPRSRSAAARPACSSRSRSRSRAPRTRRGRGRRSRRAARARCARSDARASSISSQRARPVALARPPGAAAPSIMSSPISSCTGPSWIDSATRRRTSLSACIVRRERSRARRREADSVVRSRPTTSPVASAATTNTVS